MNAEKASKQPTNNWKRTGEFKTILYSKLAQQTNYKLDSNQMVISWTGNDNSTNYSTIKTQNNKTKIWKLNYQVNVRELEKFTFKK